MLAWSLDINEKQVLEKVCWKNLSALLLFLADTKDYYLVVNFNCQEKADGVISQMEFVWHMKVKIND